VNAEQPSEDISWEGRWDTGVGRSCSIQPNSWIFIENPWVAKLSGKIGQKESKRELTSMEK
jgi:hypothetical protein